MQIFGKIETIVNSIINKVTPDLITTFMNDLKPVAVVGLGLYFIWLVLPLLLGKPSDTAVNIMTKLLVWSIVFTFAFSGSSGWLKQTNTAVNETYKWAAGETTIYQKLDSNYDTISTVATELYNSDKSPWVPLAGAISMMMVLGSYFFLGFVAIVLLVISKMILNMLLLALPLAILSILFPVIKSMFASWLQLFIENILTVLFLNIIFKIVSTELKNFLTTAASLSETPNVGNIYMLAFDVSFSLWMLLIFIAMSKILASKLASASMIQEAMSTIPKLRW